ncbi:gastrula zinc finger protein XlCGF17.1 [Bombina bombina]|uniref:gastrula zinc finger protein XlCGF17.1 n=1 Tax=Bombina bombina TaxID=8345 RepID=UPI00235A6B4B|nr:gastrula zinc finger protein XlCGF17.1 [Bombina bombina]
MRQIVTTSDLSSGSCEESSYVVVKYEEREDERNESDIEQMINTSDLITDVSVSNDIPGKHQSAVTYTKKYSPENPSISQSFQNYSKNNLTYNEYSFQNYNQTLYSRKETFDCSKNLNITGNETQLDNHQIIHPINKQLCPDLGKWFTQKSDLLKHKIINAEEKTFSCSECGKCFAHRSRLFRHKIIHTGGKPFSCLECGKCFTQKSHLNTHQKIHTGERIFSCSDCGKWFTQKSDLLKHKRIHTGEKPFLCTECGKCFTQKSHLNIHLKIHTGEKIFLCSECGKWFTQKSDFYKHKRIHTGEKPFSCSDCGKCFAQQSGLLKHKRSIHKTDYLPVLNVGNSLPGTESFIDIR